MCDLCDKQFESSNDMKSHLLIHSYKKARYKCTDFDSVGQDVVSIEVHIRRINSDKYEFGLCNFEAWSLENLEMHLTTCEIFQFDKPLCEYGFKNLIDIKKYCKCTFKSFWSHSFL